MANIFNSLTIYASKWQVKESRAFSTEEINAVEKATVVASEYGNSVCFVMKSGGQTYIPVSNESSLNIGEELDLSKHSLLTLEKPGEADIFRVQ